jgi:hypothetical protein
MRASRVTPKTSEGMCPHSTSSGQSTLYMRTKRRERAAPRKPSCYLICRCTLPQEPHERTISVNPAAARPPFDSEGFGNASRSGASPGPGGQRPPLDSQVLKALPHAPEASRKPLSTAISPPRSIWKAASNDTAALITDQPRDIPGGWYPTGRSDDNVINVPSFWATAFQITFRGLRRAVASQARMRLIRAKRVSRVRASYERRHVPALTIRIEDLNVTAGRAARSAATRKPSLLGAG